MARSNQVELAADLREQRGKGAAGRMRRQGRTPAILYGYKADPTSLSVDQLELYHALHTPAGLNVLIDLRVDGERHLCVARDLQRHAVRGDVEHVDFIAVDRDTPILVEVPVHMLGEDDAGEDGGVVNLVQHTVRVRVRPLDVPNYLELDVAGMEIGDVKRVEDLTGLPDGAEFEDEVDAAVVTINAPMDLDALLEEAAEGVEADEVPEVGAEGEEEPEDGEAAEDGDGEDSDQPDG